MAAQVTPRWFVSKQFEKEAWCEVMAARVEASDSPAGLMVPDRHIERLLAEKAHEDGGRTEAAAIGVVAEMSEQCQGESDPEAVAGR